MTINNYQKQAKRTCASLGSLKLDLAHMVLGLNTEIVELEEAIKIKDYTNIQEEIVDCIWYLANYCTFRDLKLEEFLFEDSNVHANIENLYRQVCLLQDLVKKYVAYGKEIDSLQELTLMSNIFYICVHILDKYGLSFGQGLVNNINKLKVRFPEKFTEEDAIKRNLTAERKQLEK